MMILVTTHQNITVTKSDRNTLLAEREAILAMLGVRPQLALTA